MHSDDQIAVPCVLMRGGTSKALFFHEHHLPPAGDERDSLLKRAMGTPDPLQIDGLGGAKLWTSKVAIIRRSARPDADVDYTFVQVGVAEDEVSRDGNCGNISAAVGPFAIDEQLVVASAPVTTVRIYNTNTDKVLVANVPVSNGKARVLGECAISGVPGTGAEIVMDYSRTVGARTGKLLPTGNAVDTLVLEDGRTIEYSLCDVGNPCIFVAAQALGVRGDEPARDISGDSSLIRTIREIRGKVGHALGFWTDWRMTDLPPMPMFVIVASPDGGAPMDLRARLVYQDTCHESLAGTGAICTAAASRVRGSVVHAAVRHADRSDTVIRIGHPSGVTEVQVRLEGSVGSPRVPRFAVLGFSRTARRLMAGDIYLPRADSAPIHGLPRPGDTP